MNTQNDRTRTCQSERMMTIVIALKYPSNKRIYLYLCPPYAARLTLHLAILMRKRLSFTGPCLNLSVLFLLECLN